MAKKTLLEIQADGILNKVHLEGMLLNEIIMGDIKTMQNTLPDGIKLTEWLYFNWYLQV